MLSVGFGTLGQSLLCTSATSQVVSDGTTNTQVVQNDNVSTIEGGVVSGNNLFHSFQDFSIGNGSEAFFDNPVDISNILSRVTGGNISNINGLIRANGTANLFLINPAGIVFGENASIEIGGSFYGSTADSILFAEGEFSTIDPNERPILIVNAPIGLGFRDNPARIEVTGSNNNSVELSVQTGKSFNLIGGQINLTEGKIEVEEGNITLAAISQAGTIQFSQVNEDKSLIISDNIGREVINLDDFILNIVPSVSGGDSGDINLSAKSLFLSNNSILRNRTFNTGNAGNINIDTTNSLLINSNSSISTDTFAEGNAGNIFIEAGNNFILEGINNTNLEISASASLISNRDIPGELTGNAGNIKIEAENISLNNSAQILSNTFGEGKAGNISLSGKIIDIKNNSSIFSAVGSSGLNTEADGNGGIIDIKTNTLSLSNGGTMIVQTFGTGNAGTINVDATDSINISGVADFPRLENGNTGGYSSGLFSNSETSASGIGGKITVATSALKMSEGGVINARSRGIASAGNISINADTLEITNGSQILTTAFNNGAAGNIDLNISERILISGIDPNYQNRVETLIENFGENTAEFTIDPVSEDSGVFASTTASAVEGTTGEINIQVGERLELRNGSLISARASNVRDGGNININAQDGFVVAFPSDDLGGDIVANAPQGEGGSITINSQAVLGFDENVAFDMNGDRLSNGSNDIDATGQINGVIEINSPNASIFRGIPQLSQNPVEPEQTIAQVCQNDRVVAAKNGLTVEGRGGIIPEPGLPLNSQNITVGSEDKLTSTIPAPIETAQGKIQPARGIKVSEDGTITLTAYRTNNAGDRLPDIKPNCN